MDVDDVKLVDCHECGETMLGRSMLVIRGKGCPVSERLPKCFDGDRYPAGRIGDFHYCENCLEEAGQEALKNGTIQFPWQIVRFSTEPLEGEGRGDSDDAGSEGDATGGADVPIVWPVDDVRASGWLYSPDAA